MKSNYKILILISFFLLLLSVGSSLSFYFVSMNSMEKQIKTQSLPLSLDNIYTDIQKHLIEPYLVSSMMVNDTFLKNWLKHDEKDTLQIQKYLDSVKNKYDLLVAFLVSEQSRNYYTQEGLIEKVDIKQPRNKWYFSFKNSGKKDEINLDTNDNITQDMIMFINFKILDEQFNYLGATGVGIKISYIDTMFKKFKSKYKLKVMFLNKDGKVILSQRHEKHTLADIQDSAKYEKLMHKILTNDTVLVEYKNHGNTYLINTKFVKELGIHLVVQANLDDFTGATKKNFYINLTISLILTFIIALIIIRIIHNYSVKLEKLVDYDELTSIANRRHFRDTMLHYIALTKRTKDPLCLLLIDVDDFKYVNDYFGHAAGDEVLKELANILKSNSRESDLCARWGGEEFIVALANTDLDSAKEIANKLLLLMQNNTKTKLLVTKDVTLSIGLTQYMPDETLDLFISRADQAMYEAKSNGKNRVFVID